MENKLPQHVLSWINVPENEVFFSSASVWEIVIKHSKNPAIMPVNGDTFVSECLKAGFSPLVTIHVTEGTGEDLKKDCDN